MDLIWVSQLKHRNREDEHYYTKRPKSKPRLGLIRANLRGYLVGFLTSASVFSKRRVDLGTRLLIEFMVLPEEGSILDLGCGYGPVGIVAALVNPELWVVMVDVNERAVWLARENVKRNSLNNIEVRRGFLYEPVKNMRFGAILCNPPVSAGMQIVAHIVRGAFRHLEKDGLFQLVVRTRIGGSQILSELRKVFGDVEVLARKSGYRVFLSKKS